MKQIVIPILVAIALLLIINTRSWSQTTETFETSAISNSSFTSNGVSFTLTPTNSFIVDVLSGYGYLSSNQFIDNYGTSVTTCQITSNTNFTVKSLYFYPSVYADGNSNQTSGVNVTFTGKLAGTTKFTYSPPSSDFAAASYNNSTNRGFSLVNFATPGYSNTAIDELVISLGGSTVYFAIDNFTWQQVVVSAPTATTNAAANLTATGATLNGSINANNASTSVTFEYGLTTAYGTSTTASESPVTGSTATSVSKAITGLSANTTYHYRVKGVNSAGTTNGSDQTFTTPAASLTLTSDAVGNTIFSGTSVTFTATPSGSSATNYLWKKNGVVISGATNSTYTTTNLANGDVISAQLSASSGNIVNSNLVLNLDAGNQSSYPGSGSTWTDISGNSNNASLPSNLVSSYSSSIGAGSLNFQGNSSTTIQSNAMSNWNITSTNALSVESWIKRTNYGNYQFWFSTPDLFYRLGVDPSGYLFWDMAHYVDRSAGILVSEGVWHHIIYTAGIESGNITTRVYLDGGAVASQNEGIGALSSFTNYLIGDGQTPGQHPLNGNMGLIRVYNKTLSASEVSQNFNAESARFGTGVLSSNSITMTVNPLPAPTVLSVSVPSNSTYKIGQNLDFTVNFSQAITVNTAGGTPFIPITLNAGGIVNGSYLSGSGSSALVFRYTVTSGNFDADGVSVGTAITANGGSLKNSSGTDATLTLNSVGSTASVKVDGVRPTANITINDSSLKIGETAVVTFTFSEAVSDFANADLTISNGDLLPVSSSDGGVTWSATFTPTALVEDATNVITLDNTGVTDAVGNAGSGTTNSPNYAIDTKRPTAIITSNDSSLKVGETATVTFTFSEAVSGFTNVDLNVANGNLSSVSSSDGGITWTATFTPTASVEDDTNLITLDNTGISDAAGNAGSGTTDSGNYAIDTKLPVILSVSSGNSNGNYKLNDILTVGMTFSEAVTVTGTPTLSLNSGGTASYVSGTGTTSLTFDYTVGSGESSADLDYATINSLVLAGGTITDAAGNNATLTLPTVGGASSLGGQKNLVIAINPTSGGTIAANQSGCYPFNPAEISNSALPTGYVGILEYKWQSSTTSNVAGFSDISGSNAASYDPGSLTVNTWFKRLARVDCMSDWSGAAESNVIQITVNPIPADQIVSPASQSICAGNSATISIGSSETGTNYYLRDNSNNNIIDGPKAGTGSAINFSTGILNAGKIYNILAEKSDGNSTALSMDGVDEYVSTANMNIGSTWTYETLVKANDITSIDWSGIITSNSGSGSGMWFQFSLDGSGKLRWESSGPGLSLGGIGPVINDNSWHHVAVSCDGTNIRFYTDGVLVNTTPFSGGTMNRPLHIMAERQPNQFIRGLVDQTMVWNYARSQTEIQSDKTTTLTGTEPGLLLYYTYENGTGATVSDLAGGDHNGTLMNMENEDWIANGDPLFTDNACSVQLSSTATVSISDVNTAILSSASGTDSQNACINNPITEITYSTVGATGIGSATNLPSGVTATWASNKITIKGTPSGTGTFSYSIPLTGGCGSASAAGTIIVNSLPEAPSAGSNSFIYDGTLKTATATVGSGDVIDWYASATGTTTSVAPSGTNVGTYTAYAETRNATTGCISASRTLISLVITKATLTVTADAKTKIYGEANPVLTFQYSGWKNSDDESVLTTKPTASTTVTVTSPVAVYSNAITISGGADDNYDFTYVAADFEVTKATLTVTADAKTKIYGAANPVLTFQYSGWKNNENEAVLDTKPTASTTVDLLSDVGTHINAITVSGGVDNNYDFSYFPANFVVSSKNQSISFGELAIRRYGDKEFGLTATTTSGLPISYTSSNNNVAIVSGNTVTVVGPGTSIIKASQPGNDNYTAATDVLRTLTVLPKLLFVNGTIVNSKIYDGNTDAIISGSSLSGVTGAASQVELANSSKGYFESVNAGKDILVKTAMTLTGADAVKYELLQPVGLKADIYQKEIKVTANEITTECNMVNQPLTYTFSPNLVNGDSFSGTLIREAGDDPGIYAINQGSLTLNSNYKLTFQGAGFKIVDNSPVWITPLGYLDRTLEYSDPAGIESAQSLAPIAYDACEQNGLKISKKSGPFEKTNGCDYTGTYTNFWIVKDSKGQSNTYTQIINVVDRTLPVVKELPSIQVLVAPGICETHVNYPEFAISEACIDKIELVSGKGKSGLFPVGTTKEIWKVTDKSGNWAYINFAVTIKTYNEAPIVDQVNDITVTKNTTLVEIPLTGIDPTSGCGKQEVVSIVASADNNKLISQTLTEYTGGQSSGKLILKITEGMIGESVIRVTLKDNGGTEYNGSDTKTMKFKIKVDPITEISDFKSYFDAKVYPNPSFGKVKVEVLAGDNSTLSIYGVTGNEVFKKDIVSDEVFEIDLSKNLPGFYFVKLSKANQSVIKKLILK